ncbi:PKD domain-containing protein [Ekhidna sp.]|uniref:PKD domain-containing protein n=1 Tax=Ekhidna sp. TaxID=2608089 RepID=UPI003515F82C
MKNFKNIFGKRLRILLTVFAASFIASCELRPDLPESGSIPDATPPTADFTYIPTAEDFRVISFTNLSEEATNYVWDFGSDGVVCELIDGEMVCGTETTTTAFEPYAKFEAGEGTYTVSLTALDANNASDEVELSVEVVDVFVPLPVTVVNGDFEDGTNNWKISFSNGWNNNAFKSSTDGSYNLYDGTDNGSSTGGAKWDASISVGSLSSSNSRVAYQPVVVSPSSDERTVKYILEFEYAIKDDVATDPPEGRLVIADVVAGHYTDGFEAYSQTPRNEAGVATDLSLLHIEVEEQKGKGEFTVVTGEFDAPESGLVSLMFSAITPVDVYVDNVKVYPAN